MRLRLFIAVCCGWAAATAAQVGTNTSAGGGSNSPSPPSILGATSAYALDDKHVLQPGDKISFQILEDRDPPVQLKVADSRELEVPYIGRFNVAGKTCKVLAGELKPLLEKDYYYQATVIIGLDSVNSIRGSVFVWGQVNKQGPVDLLFDQKLTVSKAILKAGGFSDFADKKHVKVMRAGATNTPVEINIQDVLDNGHSEKDIILDPDDSVLVPQRGVIFGG
ncbi:MAG: polysaccharide biosynthesis/export family protein [Verrucomicrobiota bacterium]|jgi:protein involved in polysaccharide export with SLBB domain